MSGIAASQGAPFARLLSIASSVPSRVVDNAEMCTYIDSSDEWIQQRTGIAERRWVGEGETVETMALASGRTALERAGIDASELGAVIVSTVTYFHQTPSLAAKLAFQLGTDGAAAFDISAACAGFCYGLAQAESLVRSGAATYVLVIGVEELSRFTDIHDRSTAFLFSDGAGAAVVGPSEVNGMGPVVWGSDGGQYQAITQTAGWSEALADHVTPYIQMDGRAVFKWASGFISEATKQVLDAAGLTPEDLDVFIPHQANNRITDAIVRQLALPDHVHVARDIITTGNTSAASVPLALDRMLESGEVGHGGLALLIGFGAGLAYAAQVVEIP